MFQHRASGAVCPAPPAPLTKCPLAIDLKIAFQVYSKKQYRCILYIYYHLHNRLNGDLSMSYSSRIIQLDYIRTIAIVFVVLHHVTDPLHGLPDFSTQYIFIHSIQAIAHLGVPLFFLLSGFLLIKHYPVSMWCSFYFKRFKRVMPAFIAYSYAYFVYNNNDFNFGHFVNAFLTGHTSGHLWFMYVLIGIYIITPVVSRLLTNSSANDIFIFVAASFIGGCVAYHSTVLGSRTSFSVGWMPTWSVYFVTGYLLKK